MGFWCLTGESKAAHDAHERLAQLIRSVFGEGVSREGLFKSNIQVMQSQLSEDVMFATGVEPTVLRLERARDFNILSVFAKQLREHQTACEERTAAVMDLLVSVETLCKHRKSGALVGVTRSASNSVSVPESASEAAEEQQQPRVSPRGKRTPIPQLDGSGKDIISTPSPNVTRRDSRRNNMYNDDLAEELEKLSGGIDEMRQSLDRLAGPMGTRAWQARCASSQTARASTWSTIAWARTRLMPHSNPFARSA